MADIIRSTSQWIKFFKDAGLPPTVAADYAITFSENRINLDMLTDLSKEYLYDMGIKTMGDVIAILKYAKEYHSQLVKEKMISTIDPSIKPESSSTPHQLEQPRQPTAPPSIMSRLSLPSEASPTMQAVKRPITAPRVLEYSAKSAKTSSVISRLSLPSETPSAMQAVKRPYSKVISLQSSHRNYTSESTARKMRRVLSEDEGIYQVKMPAGNTERSRQILQKKRLLQLKKRTTVFDRLGDNAVSSTTDVDKNRIKLSAFDRLGTNNGVSSTISGKSISLSSQPLQYQGVLKKTISNSAPRPKVAWDDSSSVKNSHSKRTVYNSAAEARASNVRQINEILAHNASSQQASNIKKQNIVITRHLSGNDQKPRGSILQRLGPKSGTIQLTKKSNISARLGSSFAEHKQLSVFDRLGK